MDKEENEYYDGWKLKYSGWTSWCMVDWCVILHHLVSYQIILWTDVSISYHIMISYNVIFYHIMSYQIISYHIISYHFTSHLLLSYHIIFQIFQINISIYWNIKYLFFSIFFLLNYLVRNVILLIYPSVYLISFSFLHLTSFFILFCLNIR